MIMMTLLVSNFNHQTKITAYRSRYNNDNVSSVRRRRTTIKPQSRSNSADDVAHRSRYGSGSHSYSADEFASSEDGTISCKAVTDCPKLSEEEILVKLQLDGSGATSAEGCDIVCDQR